MTSPRLDAPRARLATVPPPFPAGDQPMPVTPDPGRPEIPPGVPQPDQPIRPGQLPDDPTPGGVPIDDPDPMPEPPMREPPGAPNEPIRL